MSDSINMEVWNKDGLLIIKNSKRIISNDPKVILFEADIQGDLDKLESLASEEYGKQVQIKIKSRTITSRNGKIVER